MSDLGNLRVQTHQLDEDTIVMELNGEMDIYTTQRAKDALTLAMESGCRHVVVNLQRTSFIDSTGLGMLVGALRRLRERGGTLRLAAPTPHVRRLFEITRLTYAFPIDASVQEATERLRAGE